MNTPKPDLRVVRTMPLQKPGKSKQDYGTPADFFMALSKRFGIPDVDLAATDDNTLCRHWITPEQNSLADACDWDAFVDAGSKLAFLNPPFGEILPWAKKCAETSERLPILFLIPASVGSNWWARYVHQCASLILFTRPRLSFDGKNPYPKDCALIGFRVSHAGPRYDCWNWKG